MEIMNFKLCQYQQGDARGVALVDGSGNARQLEGIDSTYRLALRAIDEGKPLAELAGELAGKEVDLQALHDEGALLAPLDHPEPHRMLVSGTGLTHLGSAATRDEMHVLDESEKTDSMRMFELGVEGGKPAPGELGAEPEWFYKGDGSCVVAPGRPLAVPGFARDGGEEPEVVGLYVIDPDGNPRRLGFALGNEFSDHVLEKSNYLYLAHSKLRPCSFGPELLLGDLPGSVEGTSRIIRNGEVAWERPFSSGEDGMCHSIANLEAHHFKYPMFRRPGDVHAHFLGTATLSFADGFRIEDGDEAEVSCPPFGLPLRNPVRFEGPAGPVPVEPL